jgi:hypothetical protein
MRRVVRNAWYREGPSMPAGRPKRKTHWCPTCSKKAQVIPLAGGPGLSVRVCSGDCRPAIVRVKVPEGR